VLVLDRGHTYRGGGGGVLGGGGGGVAMLTNGNQQKGNKHRNQKTRSVKASGFLVVGWESLLIQKVFVCRALIIPSIPFPSSLLHP